MTEKQSTRRERETERDRWRQRETGTQKQRESIMQLKSNNRDELALLAF